jgi:peptide/nickel transport system substrate-binding protein
MGGLGIPRYVDLTGAFPDYARYVDIIRAMEAQYAYNPTECEAKITAKMEELGAVKDANGQWTWNGEPIVVIGIIRTEDERNQFGDYLCDVLDAQGFTCDRQYKTRSEASPIWALSDANEGLFHFYTAGWINNYVNRDEGSSFAASYTDLGGPYSSYQERTPTDEFYAVAEDLAYNRFADLAERDELFRQAIPMSMADATVLDLVDTKSFMAFNKDIQTSFDLAANIAASAQWAYTMRWEGVEGGTIRIAQGDLMVEPWNPIGGSNWVDDGMIQTATGDAALMNDPYTGLNWPVIVESAEVVAEEGTPVFQSDVSADWLTLSFEPTITVPADAWYDWDATAQTFTTVGDEFPEGVTAKIKATVTYPANFDGLTWHDGSPVTAADFVMNIIIGFDQGKEESAIYDESIAPTLEAFLPTHKGIRIVSTEPLVIEKYTDNFALDAENCLTSYFPFESFNYPYGGASWEMMALGIIAEAAGEMAFTADKATLKEVNRTGFLAGPEMEILATTHLPACVADPASCIPYAPTLGTFITAEEAATRFNNLTTWYATYGHLWLGTGPYYIDGVFPVEKVVTLKQNTAYPYLSDRWARFGAPKMITVAIDGAAQATIGEDATFDVYLTYANDPYPADELNSVKWLLFDATGALASQGDAELVEDGHYTVTVPTADLAAGSNRLEIASASKLVAVPGLGAFEFVTVAP